MDKQIKQIKMEKLGSILGIIVGILCIICGGINTIREIANGSFTALFFLFLAIIGLYFIHLGKDELKKNKQ